MREKRLFDTIKNLLLFSGSKVQDIYEQPEGTVLGEAELDGEAFIICVMRKHKLEKPIEQFSLIEEFTY